MSERAEATEDMEEVCARCGHPRHRHDKTDTDLVYGWVGECLAPSCDCEGFIENLDGEASNQERNPATKP